MTHIQTGDINGDGMPEVILLTADNWLYGVENDGRLTWRYELETEATTLLVADIDGDGQTAEKYANCSLTHNREMNNHY